MTETLERVSSSSEGLGNWQDEREGTNRVQEAKRRWRPDDLLPNPPLYTTPNITRVTL